MKTIKTKVVAIMLVLALALTGCVTQKSTVVINRQLFRPTLR